MMLNFKKNIMEKDLKDLNQNLNSLRQFLNYLLRTETFSSTDKIIYIFLVEKPELYKRALQAVFPDKLAKPSVEALLRLMKFIDDNIKEFEETNIYNQDRNLNYNIVFQELFL